jgi:hypothetical protein
MAWINRERPSRAGQTMADTCMHRTGSVSPIGDDWGARLVALLSLRRRHRRAWLDARDLSDHLRRDLGFLDGNDPNGRRP